MECNGRHFTSKFLTALVHIADVKYLRAAVLYMNFQPLLIRQNAGFTMLAHRFAGFQVSD